MTTSKLADRVLMGYGNDCGKRPYDVLVDLSRDEEIYLTAAADGVVVLVHSHDQGIRLKLTVEQVDELIAGLTAARRKGLTGDDSVDEIPEVPDDTRRRPR